MFARVLASLSLSIPFLVGPSLIGAAPAHADEVRTAQVRVAQARAEAVEATRQLTIGTRQWEADRAVLARLQATLAAATARVKAREAEVAAGRARVAVVARRIYMTPGLDTFGLAVGLDADQVLGLIRARGELRLVAGSDAEIVRRAKVAQLRLEAERRLVAETTNDAKLAAARAAQRLRELQALANRTPSVSPRAGSPEPRYAGPPGSPPPRGPATWPP